MFWMFFIYCTIFFLFLQNLRLQNRFLILKENSICWRLHFFAMTLYTIHVHISTYCKNGETSLFRTAIEGNWYWVTTELSQAQPARASAAVLRNARRASGRPNSVAVTKTAAQIIYLILQREWVLTLALSQKFKALIWRIQHELNIMANTTSAPSLTSHFFNTTTTTVHPVPIDPPLNTCNYFVINKNTSVVFDFNNHYGGKLFPDPSLKVFPQNM